MTAVAGILLAAGESRRMGVTNVNECLAAHLVGYGTNYVPNPPYND